MFVPCATSVWLDYKSYCGLTQAFAHARRVFDLRTGTFCESLCLGDTKERKKVGPFNEYLSENQIKSDQRLNQISSFQCLGRCLGIAQALSESLGLFEEKHNANKRNDMKGAQLVLAFLGQCQK